MNQTLQTHAPSQGLAIASLICAIVGSILILTVIGSIVGIPLIVIGLIVGIISLVQRKGGKGMAITGVVLSSIAVIGMVISAIFIGRFAGDLVPTITDFAQEMETIIEEDTELAALMDDPVFAKKVENLTEEKLIEQFAGFEDDDFSMDMLDGLVEQALDTYKTSLYELKDEYENNSPTE